MSKINLFQLATESSDELHPEVKDDVAYGSMDYDADHPTEGLNLDKDRIDSESIDKIESELEDQIEQSDRDEQAIVALENLKNNLVLAKESNSFNVCYADLVQQSFNNIISTTSLPKKDNSINIDLESFKYYNTDLAVEGIIKDIGKKIWDVIKAIFRAIGNFINKIVSFIKRIFNIKPKQKTKEIEQVEKALENNANKKRAAICYKLNEKVKEEDIANYYFYQNCNKIASLFNEHIDDIIDRVAIYNNLILQFIENADSVGTKENFIKALNVAVKETNAYVEKETIDAIIKDLDKDSEQNDNLSTEGIQSGRSLSINGRKLIEIVKLKVKPFKISKQLLNKDNTLNYNEYTKNTVKLNAFTEQVLKLLEEQLSDISSNKTFNVSKLNDLIEYSFLNNLPVLDIENEDNAAILKGYFYKIQSKTGENGEIDFKIEKSEQNAEDYVTLDYIEKCKMFADFEFFAEYHEKADKLLPNTLKNLENIHDKINNFLKSNNENNEDESLKLYRKNLDNIRKLLFAIGKLLTSTVSFPRKVTRIMF